MLRSSALWQIARYASVGGTSALVELGLFQLGARTIGLPIMTANVASVLMVTGFGFVAQKKFTFRDSQKIPPQAALYVLMMGLSFMLNNVLVYLFAIQLSMPTMLAKATQLGISFTFNFSFSKYIVFRQYRHYSAVAR